MTLAADGKVIGRDLLLHAAVLDAKQTACSAMRTVVS